MMMHRFLPFLLLLVAIAPRIYAAEPLFDSWRVYPVGTEPVASCFADFNGDGDIDIAVASKESEDVSILLNVGDGTFGETLSLWVAEEARAIDAADLDQDGDIDLAVGITHEVASVAILINRGDGTFLLPSYFGIPGSCHSVCITDFNGDGHMDIAAAVPAHKDAIILFNYGDGVFTDPLTVETGYEPRCVAASDFDHDGDMDLVSVDRIADDIHILKNTGNGRFDPGIIYPLELDPSFVYVVDLNDDGNDDMIVNMERSDSLAIFINDSNGEFSPPVYNYVGYYGLTFHCGDVDSDDDLDIVTSRYRRQSIILLNDGQGVFPDTVSHSMQFRAAYYMDVNDDGEGEFIGLSYKTRLHVLPLDNGHIPEITGYGQDHILDLVAEDFDGDGNMDLAGSINGGDSIVILTNTGRGEFFIEYIPIIGVSARRLIAVDIEGDNDIDLIVEKAHQQALIIMFNDGAGVFESAGDVPLQDNPIDFVADDLDGDGDIDLAYTFGNGNKDDTIVIMHHTGNGVFEYQMDLADSLDYRSLCTADFNGDGEVDLGASYWGGVAVYLNVGSGSFGPGTLYPASPASTYIDTGDFDGDGDIDIVGVDSFRGNVWILSNDGNGVFLGTAAGSLSGWTYDVGVADLDNDGDHDFIGSCYDYSQHNAAVMLNDGGSLLPAQCYGGFGLTFVLADLDNDGDIDMASNTKGISILFNQTEIVTDAHDAEITDLPIPGWYLSQNFPNPFNPMTQIEYMIPRRSYVTLHVHNILGQRVVTLVDNLQTAGMHKIQWNGKDAYGHSVSSGIYFYQLSFENVINTKKMIMLK
jgi:hypothetical protein